MSVATLHPASNSSTYNAWTTVVPSGADKWTTIDEDSNDDSDYVQGGGAQDQCFMASSTECNAVPAGATISKITVYYRGGCAAPRTMCSLISLGGTTAVGSNTSQESITPTDYSTDFTTKPGGGAWAQTDLANLHFGVRANSGSGTRRCYRLYVVVTYTAASNHPDPTSLECDRASSQTAACDAPLFTAIWQATGDSGTATHTYIQVSANADFSSPVWDSGWTAITNIGDNTRCQEIKYAGSTLASNVTYYWRIKFKDGSAVESTYASSTFSGITRAWPSAMAGYTHRQKILWDTPHMAIPSAYQQDFNFQTGLREIIATNGSHNESIQSSGGFQVEYFNGKTHVVYLGKDTASNDSKIYIQTYNHLTGNWGTPYIVVSAMTNFDTHFFPSMCIDLQGYIHIAYGCHYTALQYVRSTQPNVSGALPGEPASGNYTTAVTPTGATYATYPILFTEVGGRVYLLWRYGSGTDAAYQWKMHYSDDNGATWHGPYVFIEDKSAYKKFAYCYGLRYDKAKRRLHISYTFNQSLTIGGGTRGNVERGLWYAYSDFGDTTSGAAGCGFDIWRLASGTIAGYTESNSLSQNCLGFETTNPIVLSYVDGFGTNNLSKYFTTNMVLDKNGEPIAFAGQKFYNIPVVNNDDTPGVEAYLTGFKWSANIGSAGSWQTILVSDQVNLPLRFQRCSIGVQTDRDGIIHAWMPVNGKTYHWIKPTTDVDSVNCTRKSEASNKLEVDDGIATCDGDGSYVDVAKVSTTDGKMSFSSSDALPTDATILGVQVYGIIKRSTGSDATINFYLNNSSTDNHGSNQTAGAEYLDFYGDWATNPFTSAAWAAADFSTLRFGIRVTSTAGARVSKLYLRVYYMTACDDDYFATEIWELTSADNGLTWTKREVSRNSHVGIPIMSAKHHLTNDQIEVVWCSGQDVFYLTDKAYGLVQRSGKDFRIAYGGTEIDRLLDYPNLKSTRVTFKTQGAIAANAAAGADDYYIYWGNPNETTNPKANPANVWDYFEGFEQRVNDTNPNGLDGWSVISGTWRSYGSPPGTSNKCYAGNMTMHATAAGELQRTLGSGLTDIQIEGAVWLEGTGGNSRALLKLIDGSSNSASVGPSGLDTGVAGYGINASFFTITGFKASAPNWWRFKIQVTANGVTAYFGDLLMIRDKSTGITAVNLLSLIAPDEAFFDHIIMRKRLAKSVATTRTTGLTPDSTLGYNNATTGYDAANDALITTLGTHIHKVTATLGVTSSQGTGTVTFRVACCPGTSWSDSTMEASTTVTITISSAGVEVTGQGVLTDLVENQKAVKIDLYAYTGFANNGDGFTPRIVNIIEEDVAQEPTITLQTAEIKGFTMGAVLQGKSQLTFTMSANISGVHMWALRSLAAERNSAVTRAGRAAIETKMTLDGRRLLSVETGVTSNRTARMDIETLENHGGAVRFMAEYLANNVAARGLAEETRAMLARGQALAVEVNATAQAYAQVLIEAGYSVSTTRRIGVEANSQLIYTRQIPLAYLSQVNAPSSLAAESLITLTATHVVPAEHLNALQRMQALPIDIKSILATVTRTAVETFVGVEAHTSMAQEVLEVALQVQRLPVEFSKLLLRPTPLPFGTLASVSAVKQSPAEINTGLVSIRQYLIECNTAISANRLYLPVETFLSLVDVAQIPIDWDGQLRTYATVRIPIETISQLSSPVRLLAETIGQVLASRSLPQSVLTFVGQVMRTPVDWGLAARQSAMLQLPVEILNTPVSVRRVPFERIQIVTAQRSVSIEFTSAEVARTRLPLEHLAIIERVARAFAETIALTQYTGRIRVEYVNQVGASIQFQIETNEHRTIDLAAFPLEVLANFVATAQVPFDWQGVAITSLVIVDAALRLPGLSDVAIRLLAILDAAIESQGTESTD